MLKQPGSDKQMTTCTWTKIWWINSNKLYNVMSYGHVHMTKERVDNWIAWLPICDAYSMRERRESWCYNEAY